MEDGRARPGARRFRGARRRSRLNRSLSFLLGAALIGSGALGAVATGAVVPVPVALPAGPPLPEVPHEWIPHVVIVAALVSTVLGAWWLSAQRDADRLHRIVRGRDTASGSTVLSGRALADAVADTVARSPGVLRARARLNGAGHAPRLYVEATVTGDVDVRSFLRACEETVIEALRVSLGVPEVPAIIVVTVADGVRTRVR
ncbi:hypothetical protein PWG71_19090 [Nocardiopsis sp. N85]|uniref:hypothetical protein n=1 Tax=Nocardiopsis sp. N85 TaxID=3029400 RepID=UPI00237F1FB9|nr:hypothetical protein [Nocardiopsis sp. N85]MDE3723500.1 hypothetical protein [Nocardiopsis sp. N85]